MFGLSSSESFALGVAALWIYSAAVAALPDPTDKSSAFYTWVYKFLKIIAGDLSAKFGKYIPTAAAILALMLFVPTVYAADTTTTSGITFSASTGAVAVYDAGSWEAATHITESLDFLDFGSAKANHVYIDGHEFLATASSFNFYGAGVGVQPNLKPLFSKTNISGDNLSLKLGAALGNRIPTTGTNSHMAGLFSATFSYRASSTVSWVPFEYDAIVYPGGVTHALSMSLTKYF